MPLTNCKVELKLKWAKYSVLSAACNVMIMIMITMVTILFLLSKT